MTDREILIGFISSLLGGFIGALVLWIIQQTYLNRREKKREQDLRIVKSSNAEKIIPPTIFEDFGLGASIEQMRAMLGSPNKFRRTDYPVFSDAETKTNSYLYIFSNAYMKVTSIDNEIVDTITLHSLDNSISFESYPMPCDFNSYKLGEAEVCEGLVAAATNHKHIVTRFDSSFALEFYTGGPDYDHYTFFGFLKDHQFEYQKTQNPKLFIGAIIEGVCKSSSAEEVYFIYENEIR